MIYSGSETTPSAPSCVCAFCSLGKERKISYLPVPCISKHTLVRAHTCGTWNKNTYGRVLLSYHHSVLLFRAVTGMDLTVINLTRVCQNLPLPDKPVERKVGLEKAVLWYLTLAIPLVNVIRLIQFIPCKDTLENPNLQCGVHWAAMYLGVRDVRDRWVGEMSSDLAFFFDLLYGISFTLAGLLFGCYDETKIVSVNIISEEGDKPFLHLSINVRENEDQRPFIILPKYKNGGD